MTKDEFLALKAGDVIGWSQAGYERSYDVLAPPQRAKSGPTVAARCRFYGDHVLTYDDVKNWKKK